MLLAGESRGIHTTHCREIYPQFCMDTGKDYHGLPGVNNEVTRLGRVEYPFLEPEDIQACLLFAYRSLAGEHVYDRVSIQHTL
jgi:hypothetical protein